MLRDDMTKELQRLNGFVYKASGEEARRRWYVDELYRRYGDLEYLRWKEIVTFVIDHIDSRQLPTMEQWQRAVVSTASKNDTYSKGWMTPYQHQNHCVKEAQELSPTGALKVLKGMDGLKTPMPDEVMEILTRRAAEYVEQSAPTEKKSDAPAQQA